MNVIARLEYELAYYDSAVHRFNHYTTRTPPLFFNFTLFVYNHYIDPVIWHQVFLSNTNNLSPKTKRSFFQAAVVSILLYGCTTWTLTKHQQKKLDGNYTRMLRAILNKFWRQHLTKRQMYGHLPPITKTIKVRRIRLAERCWRSRNELISDVLPWTPAYGQAKAGWPARTYIQQLCEDTGCSFEDLPEAMNDWEEWPERVRDIRASDTWWWGYCLKSLFLFNENYLFIHCWMVSRIHI